jgi:hypothetical protein
VRGGGERRCWSALAARGGARAGGRAREQGGGLPAAGERARQQVSDGAATGDRVSGGGVRKTKWPQRGPVIKFIVFAECPRSGTR